MPSLLAEAMLDPCARNGLWAISDEAYEHFVIDDFDDLEPSLTSQDEAYHIGQGRPPYLEHHPVHYYNGNTYFHGLRRPPSPSLQGKTHFPRLRGSRRGGTRGAPGSRRDVAYFCSTHRSASGGKRINHQSVHYFEELRIGRSNTASHSLAGRATKSPHHPHITPISPHHS
jgi:hypothetical protein